MVLGIQFEQQFQQGRRHFEIVDQEVIDGRCENQLQGRPRIAVVPLQHDLLLFGNQLGKALKRLETFVASSFDIARRLHFAAAREHFAEIIRPAADDFERLVGRRVQMGCIITHPYVVV